jgi:predicted metal-binding protein
MPPDTVDLLVCTTCRSAIPANPLAVPDTEMRPGAELVQALQLAAPEGVRVLAVECLSNCSRGCTVALRKPGAWTYVYGNLTPENHVPTILEGAQKYRDAENGLVPWRERPEHFRKNCIARIPPLEAPNV